MYFNTYYKTNRGGVVFLYFNRKNVMRQLFYYWVNQLRTDYTNNNNMK